MSEHSALLAAAKEKTMLMAYVKDALDAVLEASEGNATSYTCGEVERIAELFEYVGRRDDANVFRLAHAFGDDDESQHHVCSQCREALAEEHGMCGSCLHDAKRSGWEPGTEES
jgi:hypothetical protein